VVKIKVGSRGWGREQEGAYIKGCSLADSSPAPHVLALSRLLRLATKREDISVVSKSHTTSLLKCFGNAKAATAPSGVWLLYSLKKF